MLTYWKENFGALVCVLADCCLPVCQGMLQQYNLNGYGGVYMQRMMMMMMMMMVMMIQFWAQLPLWGGGFEPLGITNLT